MYAEIKKIRLIQEVLKITSKAPLEEIEKVLLKWKKAKNKKKTINDFVGVLSNAETKGMKKAIADTSEKIHPDDWK
jgi:hypothetical protein